MVAVLLAVQQAVIYVLLAFIPVIDVVELAVIYPYIAGVFNADGISLAGSLQHMVNLHVLDNNVFTAYHPDADAVAFSVGAYADDGNVRHILHQQLVLGSVVQGDGSVYINCQGHIVRLAVQCSQELVAGGNRNGSAACTAGCAGSIANGSVLRRRKPGRRHDGVGCYQRGDSHQRSGHHPPYAGGHFFCQCHLKTPPNISLFFGLYCVYYSSPFRNQDNIPSSF